MHEYRIEKTRLSLFVRLQSGEAVHGSVFLPQAVFGTPPTTALELLNDAEPFFPLDCEDIGILLIAKDRLVEAWGDAVGNEDEMRIATMRAVAVELWMADGRARTGTMLLEVPMDRPRLLDFLNDHRQRFVRMDTPDGPHIINARLIERARPLD